MTESQTQSLIDSFSVQSLIDTFVRFAPFILIVVATIIMVTIVIRGVKLVKQKLSGLDGLYDGYIRDYKQFDPRIFNSEKDFEDYKKYPDYAYYIDSHVDEVAREAYLSGDYTGEDEDYDYDVENRTP